MAEKLTQPRKHLIRGTYRWFHANTRRRCTYSCKLDLLLLVLLFSTENDLGDLVLHFSEHQTTACLPPEDSVCFESRGLLFLKKTARILRRE